jgi:uncharacterized protein involved in cysteine biosynthesis
MYVFAIFIQASRTSISSQLAARLGEVASFAANGLLLGREYFELVALRHMDLEQASQLRRNNSSAVWLAGTLIALSSMIPVINLVRPLLDTSLMVHLFHRFAQTSGQKSN